MPSKEALIGPVDGAFGLGSGLGATLGEFFRVPPGEGDAPARGSPKRSSRKVRMPARTPIRTTTATANGILAPDACRIDVRRTGESSHRMAEEQARRGVRRCERCEHVQRSSCKPGHRPSVVAALRQERFVAARPHRQAEFRHFLARFEAEPCQWPVHPCLPSRAFDRLSDSFLTTSSEVLPHDRVKDDGRNGSAHVFESYVEPISGIGRFDRCWYSPGYRDRGIQPLEAVELVAPDKRLQAQLAVPGGRVDRIRIASRALNHLARTAERHVAFEDSLETNR